MTALRSFGLAAAALAGCASPSIPPQPRDEMRLIGFACGPQRLTLLAAEEDELPAPCERVEQTADACNRYVSDLEVEKLAPQACRDFWTREAGR